VTTGETTGGTDRTGGFWRMGLGAPLLAGLVLLSAASALSAQEVKAIKPGMSEAQVREAWGAPLTSRKAGVMTYLYYKNDCLRTCGTYDVVFLENDQVIDAVVRDKGRTYDGIASSPRDRKPEPTVNP
jgi:SmpA / OmlA family